MADPVIEKVALALVTKVQNVTTANGYTYTLTQVVRETATMPPIEHLLAIVSQDYADDASFETSNDVIVTVPVDFSVLVCVMPPEEDQTAIDRYLNYLWADVTKAVTTSWDDKTAGTIGGLVYTWSVLSPVRFTPSDLGCDGIACRFRALVRVEEKNPYTQR